MGIAKRLHAIERFGARFAGQAPSLMEPAARHENPPPAQTSPLARNTPAEPPRDPEQWGPYPLPSDFNGGRLYSACSGYGCNACRNTGWETMCRQAIAYHFGAESPRDTPVRPAIKPPEEGPTKQLTFW